MQIQDGMPRPGRMFLSIVVPCCNEEEGLREFHRQMTAAARALCGQRFELILVDDGSTDNTWKLINELSAEDRNVVAVRLARNHGHQLALTAGLSTVRGDLVLVIDADLQDPPELLAPMYEMMAARRRRRRLWPAPQPRRRNPLQEEIGRGVLSPARPDHPRPHPRGYRRLPPDEPPHLRPARTDAGT